MTSGERRAEDAGVAYNRALSASTDADMRATKLRKRADRLLAKWLQASGQCKAARALKGK